MTNFNPNIFNDPLGGFAEQYGVPSCMVNLYKSVLNLLPGDILGGIQRSVAEGRRAAQDDLATITREIWGDTGIIQFNTQTGLLSFRSNASTNGDPGLADSLDNFLGQVAGYAGALWKNYQAISDEIEAIEKCLGDFRDFMNAKGSSSDVKALSELAPLGRFESYKTRAKNAEQFIEQCNTTISNIDEIFYERSVNADLIPELVTDPIEEDTSPIFRLTYGPPRSKKGQFLLSVDGLYYDSQGEGGVPTQEQIGFIPQQERWELDHAANLGGRGKGFSMEDLNRYVDTIFDPNVIDNTQNLEPYYDADHFLQVIMANKNSRVEYLQANLLDLVASGYQKGSAMHVNVEQQLNSEIAGFDAKINKRKKQIEVAVKAPDLFGATAKFQPGEIPVNNFSYLSSINLDVEVEKQKGLTFDHGEVDDVVLPVQPIFVKSSGSQQSVVVAPLLVGEMGTGAHLDGEELEGAAPMLSLTTGITTDELVCVYNFTDGNIHKPGSEEYNTLNCNAQGTEHRGKLVARTPGLVFKDGLGAPYFRGITCTHKEDSDPYAGGVWGDEEFYVSSVGSYLELPNTQTFQDLMYSPSGCTIDAWIKIDGIKQEEKGFWQHPLETSSFSFKMSPKTDNQKWKDFHYNRVLLACENTGGKNNNVAASSVVSDRSTDFVRGMVMGFSRSPKIVWDTFADVNDDVNIRAEFGNPAGDITMGSDMVNPFEAGGDTEVTWVVSGLDVVQPPSGTALIKPNRKNLKDVVITEYGDGLQASDYGVEYKLNVYPEAVYGASTDDVSATIDAPTADGSPVYANNIVFFIAPTQSYNTSGVGFVRAGDCSNERTSLLKYTVDIDKVVGNVAMSAMASEYIHLAVAFDPTTDEIRTYVDGVLYDTGRISETFDVPVGGMPQVPSIVTPSGYDTSSFYYSETTINAGEEALAQKTFADGPTHNGFFTPWIVGGGFTDGRPVDLDTSSGGFMGPGDGIHSGFHGNIGSFKVYCRALDTNEVKATFDSQETFFKNFE